MTAAGATLALAAVAAPAPAVDVDGAAVVVEVVGVPAGFRSQSKPPSVRAEAPRVKCSPRTCL